MIPTTSPNARTENLVIQNLEDEMLVFDTRTNKAFCLNSTSELIWELCDGKRTIKQISDELSSKLKTPISEEFVLIALDGLRRNNLLESDFEIDKYFEGFSRRTMIRKVGFASVVALPLIYSVVAPTAASAQSMLAFCNVTATFPCLCPDSGPGINDCRDAVAAAVPGCWLVSDLICRSLGPAGMCGDIPAAGSKCCEIVNPCGTGLDGTAPPGQQGAGDSCAPGLLMPDGAGGCEPIP